MATLLLLTLIAFLPAMRAGWIWDDDYYVTNNRNLRSVGGLVDLWTKLGAVPQYYPLTHTTFWVEYHLWGLRPAGYHVVNIVLHAASSVLLWLILRRLAVPGALLAAAVFAVHPLHVESVAWVTERKNVLSGVLYLGAMLAYLKGSGFGVQGAGNAQTASGAPAFASLNPEPRTLNPRSYSLVLLLFIAALLSKSVTASLPAAILLIVWWKRGRITWADLKPLLSMVALGVAMGMLTSHMERTWVGAQGPEWDLSFAQRLLIAGRAVWFYAWKLVWPTRLTFVYPRWEVDGQAAWQWIFPVAAIGLLAVAWALRRRAGSGPLVALLFFGGTLVPALGFVNLLPMRYSFVADHFAYLASIGPIVLIVAAIPARGRLVLGPVLLLVLGVLTFRQCFAYRDLRALWLDTIEKNPGAWMARNNYASLLITDGKLDEAEKELTESIRLKPTVEALMNLGAIAERRGDLDGALARHRQALALRPENAVAMTSVGRLLAARGEVAAAMALLERAAGAFPPYALAYRELGIALRSQGRLDEAIGELRRALEINPGLAVAANDLGIALAAKQDYAEAVEAFGKAVRADAGFADAYNNLGA
ncbi:MAG: tetratricopeptide repeat protein, partial [Tepidisphaeraceae bacterium]